MRRFRLLFGLLVLAATAHLGFALFGAYQLRQAVVNKDAAELERRVDWNALRAQLKNRLKLVVGEESRKFGAAGQVIGNAMQGSLADKTIDALVSPAWLVRALRGRELIPMGSGGSTTGERDDDSDPLPPRRLRWAFFESPTRFRIEAVHPRLEGSRIVAILALEGTIWKLVDVDVIKV